MHKKRHTFYIFFHVFISNVFLFFSICPQSYISHYYVRSVFPLTAMAVNYTRAQTQRGPLTSREICHFKAILDQKNKKTTLQ